MLFIYHPISSSADEHKSINREFYNYLALDLSSDILQAYAESEKSPAKAQLLNKRLEGLSKDVTAYTTGNKVAAHFLTINKVLSSLQVIVADFNHPQRISEPAPVNIAVHHVRDYLNEYAQILVNDDITQLDNDVPFTPEGEWQLTDTVNDGLYKGMTIGFKLRIKKGDDTFEAEGEKYRENGEILPEKRRSPIRIYALIINNVVRAAYREGNLKTGSTGEFIWRVQSDGTLSGLFTSSTGAKGESHLKRLTPDDSGKEAKQ